MDGKEKRVSVTTAFAGGKREKGLDVSYRRGREGASESKLNVGEKKKLQRPHRIWVGKERVSASLSCIGRRRERVPDIKPYMSEKKERRRKFQQPLRI